MPLPPEKLKAGMDELARNRRLLGDPIPAPAHGGEGLKQIVLKACAYDVKDRYASAAELLADLNRLGGAVATPISENQASELAAESAENHAKVSVETEEEMTVSIYQVGMGIKKAEPMEPVKAAEPSVANKVEVSPKVETVSEQQAVEDEQEEKTVGLYGYEPVAKEEKTVALTETERGLKKESTETVKKVEEPETMADSSTTIIPEGEDIPEIKPQKKRIWWVAGITSVIVLIGIILPICFKNGNVAPIVEIDAYSNHLVALHSNGRVSVVVDERFDLGQGNTASWRNIVAISAGWRHTVGLKSDGTVVAVGSNEEGQCEVSKWRDIVAICAGQDSTFGLKRDGTVLVAGNYSDYNDYYTSFSELSNVKCIDVCTNQFMWVDTYGNLFIRYIMYRHDGGYEVRTDVLKKTDCRMLCCIGFYVIGLNADGTATIINPDEYMEQNCGNLKEAEGRDWHDVQELDRGFDYVMGLRSDGTVVACGKNEFSQCNVSSWTDIVDIAAGSSYSLGLKSDGTIVTTGDVPFDVSKLCTK